MDNDWDPELEEFMAEQPGEPSERDVWMAANKLMKTYGQDAVLFASMRADEWLAKGDMSQYRLSKRILTTIDELLTMAPPPGTKVS